MARYWVTGGEYADTSFAALAPGKAEERHGPYMSYDEAFKLWRERSMAKIDYATIRYRIIEESVEPR